MPTLIIQILDNEASGTPLLWLLWRNTNHNGLTAFTLGYAYLNTPARE